MSNIKEAIKILKSGGIVIFPTDTAIGIGCRIDHESAVKRLFRIRKRSESKPLLALVNSVEMARKYWETIPQDVTELIKKYWPGPLTLVLHSAKEKVPGIVTSGTNNLGIRQPDNELVLKLIKGVGVPIVAPSANFAGEKTPFKFEDLDPKLINLADYILNNEVSSAKNVSTVIDCSKKPWKVLRQGVIRISNF